MSFISFALTFLAANRSWFFFLFSSYLGLFVAGRAQAVVAVVGRLVGQALQAVRRKLVWIGKTNTMWKQSQCVSSDISNTGLRKTWVKQSLQGQLSRAPWHAQIQVLSHPLPFSNTLYSSSPAPEQGHRIVRGPTPGTLSKIWENFQCLLSQDKGRIPQVRALAFTLCKSEKLKCFSMIVRTMFYIFHSNF